MKTKIRSRRDMTPEELDLAFLNNPNEWPRWPMLPLKRRNKSHLDAGDFFCGLYIHGLGLNVYNLNMFHLPNSPLIHTWQDAVKGVEHMAYNTAEALIADWRVD